MSELSCADEDHPLKQAESLPLKPDTDAGVEGIPYTYIFSSILLGERKFFFLNTLNFNNSNLFSRYKSIE